jgi:hypothetical protein
MEWEARVEVALEAAYALALYIKPLCRFGG